MRPYYLLEPPWGYDPRLEAYWDLRQGFLKGEDVPPLLFPYCPSCGGELSVEALWDALQCEECGAKYLKNCHFPRAMNPEMLEEIQKPYWGEEIGCWASVVEELESKNQEDELLLHSTYASYVWLSIPDNKEDWLGASIGFWKFLYGYGCYMRDNPDIVRYVYSIVPSGFALLESQAIVAILCSMFLDGYAIGIAGEKCGLLPHKEGRKKIKKERQLKERYDSLVQLLNRMIESGERRLPNRLQVLKTLVEAVSLESSLKFYNILEPGSYKGESQEEIISFTTTKLVNSVGAFKSAYRKMKQEGMPGIAEIGLSVDEEEFEALEDKALKRSLPCGWEETCRRVAEIIYEYQLERFGGKEGYIKATKKMLYENISELSYGKIMEGLTAWMAEDDLLA